MFICMKNFSSRNKLTINGTFTYFHHDRDILAKDCAVCLSCTCCAKVNARFVAKCKIAIGVLTPVVIGLE